MSIPKKVYESNYPKSPNPDDTFNWEIPCMARNIGDILEAATKDSILNSFLRQEMKEGDTVQVENGIMFSGSSILEYLNKKQAPKIDEGKLIKISGINEGITGTLYINDDKRTVDTIKDHKFDSATLADFKKEIAKMSRELRKENPDLWYQGEVEIDGVKYTIEDTTISVDEAKESGNWREMKPSDHLDAPKGTLVNDKIGDFLFTFTPGENKLVVMGQNEEGGDGPMQSTAAQLDIEEVTSTDAADHIIMKIKDISSWNELKIVIERMGMRYEVITEGKDTEEPVTGVNSHKKRDEWVKTTADDLIEQAKGDGNKIAMSKVDKDIKDDYGPFKYGEGFMMKVKKDVLAHLKDAGIEVVGGVKEEKDDAARIDKMIKDWEKNGKAYSNLSNDDDGFFAAIGVGMDGVATTSQTGDDIIYYDTNVYANDKDAIAGKKSVKEAKKSSPIGPEVYGNFRKEYGLSAILFSQLTTILRNYETGKSERSEVIDALIGLTSGKRAEIEKMLPEITNEGQHENQLYSHKLVIGKKYEWLMGAEPLQIEYVGRRKDNPDIKCGTTIGTGLIFKWCGKTDGYIEIGSPTLLKYVEEVEPEEAKESKMMIPMFIKEAVEKAQSLAQVNKELHKKHPKIDIVKGKGYYYIASDDEEMGLKLAGLYTTSIPVFSITQQTVDQWLADVDLLLKDENSGDMNEKKSIVDVKKKEGTMHKLLGLKPTDNVSDHYKSGKALATALANKTTKAKASSLLNYAANINKNADPIFRAASDALKKMNESDKSELPTDEEIELQEKIDEYIKDMLHGDGMDIVFDAIGMNMPKELEGEDYTETMEEAEEEARKLYKEHPELMVTKFGDPYRFQGLNESIQLEDVIIGAKVKILRGRGKGQNGKIVGFQFDDDGELLDDQIDVKLDDGNMVYLGQDDITPIDESTDVVYTISWEGNSYYFDDPKLDKWEKYSVEFGNKDIAKQNFDKIKTYTTGDKPTARNVKCEPPLESTNEDNKGGVKIGDRYNFSSKHPNKTLAGRGGDVKKIEDDTVYLDMHDNDGAEDKYLPVNKSHLIGKEVTKVNEVKDDGSAGSLAKMQTDYQQKIKKYNDDPSEMNLEALDDVERALGISPTTRQMSKGGKPTSESGEKDFPDFKLAEAVRLLQVAKEGNKKEAIEGLQWFVDAFTKDKKDGVDQKFGKPIDDYIDEYQRAIDLIVGGNLNEAKAKQVVTILLSDDDDDDETEIQDAISNGDINIVAKGYHLSNLRNVPAKGDSGDHYAMDYEPGDIELTGEELLDDIAGTIGYHYGIVTPSVDFDEVNEAKTDPVLKKVINNALDDIEKMEPGVKELQTKLKDFISKYATGKPTVGKYGGGKNKYIVPFNGNDAGMRQKMIVDIGKAGTDSPLSAQLSCIDSVEGKLVFHIPASTNESNNGWEEVVRGEKEFEYPNDDWRKTVKGKKGEEIILSIQKNDDDGTYTAWHTEGSRDVKIDFGILSVESAKDILDDYAINHLGVKANEEKSDEPVFTEDVHGIRKSLLNMQYGYELKFATDHKPDDLGDKTLEEYAKEKTIAWAETASKAIERESKSGIK